MQGKPFLIYHRGRHGRDIRVKENTLEAFQRAIDECAPMIEFDVWDEMRVTHDRRPWASAPHLWDVMELINGQCSINIDIKSPVAFAGVAGIVSYFLNWGNFEKYQIVLSSFHHFTAVDMKKIFPELRVSIINDGVMTASYIEWLAKEGISNLHIDRESIAMDIEGGYKMRDAAFANGMQIWTYTVNSKDIFKTVAEYGVGAVFTDVPHVLKSA